MESLDILVQARLYDLITILCQITLNINILLRIDEYIVKNSLFITSNHEATYFLDIFLGLENSPGATVCSLKLQRLILLQLLLNWNKNKKRHDVPSSLADVKPLSLEIMRL